MSENAFTRWSRRKRGLEAETAETVAVAVPEPALSPAEAPAPDETREETEAEFLERTGLPDPDDLTPGADYSAYLRGRVPAALRRRAMRSLWRSDPVFACLDGLNDYDDDYTGGALKDTVVQTAYEVGRGFRKLVAADGDPCDNPPVTAGDAVMEADASSPGAMAGEGSEEPQVPTAQAAPETDPPVDTLRDPAEAAENGADERAGESVSTETITASGSPIGAAARRSRMRFDVA